MRGQEEEEKERREDSDMAGMHKHGMVRLFLLFFYLPYSDRK